MSPKHVVITGANRGIGLELVKQLTFLPDPPVNIFALCRNPDKAEELKKITSNVPGVNVHLMRADITNADEINQVYDEVDKIIGTDGLNCLVNNAGINVHDTSLFDDLVNVDELMNHYRTNAVGPLMMTKKFVPLLQRAAAASPDLALGSDRASVVIIGTSLTSLELNTPDRTPVFYSYRMSKAALNMAARNLVRDLQPKGILVQLIHPGWVKTDMGGPMGDIDVETSVRGVVEQIQKLGEKEAGLCYAYDGSRVPF